MTHIALLRGVALLRMSTVDGELRAEDHRHHHHRPFPADDDGTNGRCGLNNISGLQVDNSKCCSFFFFLGRLTESLRVGTLACFEEKTEVQFKHATARNRARARHSFCRHQIEHMKRVVIQHQVMIRHDLWSTVAGICLVMYFQRIGQ